MRTTLALILFFSIAFRSWGAEFTFKDGTSINASIYEHPAYGPNKEGLILVYQNKVYIHHYPSYHKKKLADDGSYGPYEKIPVAPTTLSMSENPPFLPTCTPVRIKFIYFSSKTLRSLDKKYSAKLKLEKAQKHGYSSIGLSYPTLDKLGEVTLAVNEALNNKKYLPANKDVTKIWQINVVRHFRGSKNVIWGKYLHERHHFGRR